MSTKQAYGDPKLHIGGDKACNWCEEPSTPDNKVKPYPYDLTKLNNTYLWRHEKCQEEAKKNADFSPVENYIAASRKIAVYPTLVCDNPHCDADIDLGDDNETDSRQAVGEPCWNCNRGQLEYRSAAFAGEYTNPYKDPAHGQGALQRYPMTEDPAAPMEQGGGNLDPNLDGVPPRNPVPVPPGTGDIPGTRSATTTYDNLRNHLIEGHQFKEHWLQGYNPRQLLGVHLQHHFEHNRYTPDLNKSHY